MIEFLLGAVLAGIAMFVAGFMTAGYFAAKSIEEFPECKAAWRAKNG